MSGEPARKFGPYEVIAPIGEGGMGQVFRARDTPLDRIVALKISHAPGNRLDIRRPVPAVKRAPQRRDMRRQNTLLDKCFRPDLREQFLLTDQATRAAQ